MDLNLTTEALDQIMADIHKELEAYSSVAKSEDGSASKPEESPDKASPGDEAKSAPAASLDKPAAAPPAEHPTSPAQADAASAPAGSPQAASATIQPAPTVEGLAAEYCQLDPESLKMHYMACKQAMMQSMGQDGAAAMAPPASPAAPASPGMQPALKNEMSEHSEKSEGSMHKGEYSEGSEKSEKSGEKSEKSMGKAEMSAKAAPKGKDLLINREAVGGQVSHNKSTFGKSEEVVADLVKAEVSKFQDELSVLKSKLAKSEEERNVALQLAEVALRPVRKAITGVSELDFVPKSEKPPEVSPYASMSKSELTQVLREKSRGEDLKKSDRDLINSYCLGHVDFSKIQHILAPKGGK